MDVPTQIGLKMDEEGDEVGRLQNYLKRFGYIRPDEERPYGLKIDVEKAARQPEPMVFDSPTQKALKRFQEFNRLRPTGVLDKATINLMLKPRCGLPDFVVPEGQIVDYVYSGKKWTKLDLTYTFQNYTPDLTQSEVQSAIGSGLFQWSLAAPLNFSEASSGGDLKFSWGSGDHGCGYPFDGPSGVLAHAFYPEDGRVHFDEDELWTNDSPPSGIDLASVAIHELGHALGLAHSNDTNAVMYAYYSGIRRTLTKDDIEGIQYIYGKRKWKCPIAKIASTTTIPVIQTSTQFLREFRDEVVLKSMFKTPFERILDRYYELTPIINKKMDSSAIFRQIVKGVVYPFIIGTKGAVSLTLASMRKSNHSRLRMRP
ncbi:MAG: matrixin family metalloprotease [Candidatus Bathyarchaeum sp.]|nr:MAG: matrixin family metalloprotease [Candidatus Bathyarchaeum sp.]